MEINAATRSGIKIIHLLFILLLEATFSTSQSEDVILKVIGGGGFPESTGNTVPIYLRNEKSMDGCDFDLVFDTDKIVIRDVTLTNSSRVQTLDWSVIDSGVRVSVRSKIYSGAGILANIVFDVEDSSPLDTYPLILSNVVVYPKLSVCPMRMAYSLFATPFWRRSGSLVSLGVQREK